VAARLVGEDPHTDLAVLKTDTRFPRALALAEARARMGQLVLAIGNPLRFEGSVSLGVVSALERELSGRHHVLEGLIQTDAAINPGNSGGPLVDVHGGVVGINTAMLAFAQGIGFAIPAHTVSWVTAALIQRGRIERPKLGIAARGEALAPRLAESLGQQRAVRVLRVEAGSPAAGAGVRAGDFILALDAAPTGAIDDIHRILVLSQARELALTFLRDGERRCCSVLPRFQQAA
jgi:S1-C subfamily serine protease